MSGAAVHCRRLVQIFPSVSGQVAALAGVDLEVAPGEQVALIGPSGSGKSTLLGLLAGAFPPSAGELVVDEHDLTTATSAELQRMRARTVGTLIQGGGRNLLGYADAAANIGYARRALRRREARLLPAAADLLADVGIDRVVARRPVAELSGGERQRVALGVALANDPRLLLVDEPTSDLDPDLRDAVMDVVVGTSARLGCTTVVVTHDPAVAARLTRRITIHDGRVEADTRRGGHDVVEVDAAGRLTLPSELQADWPAGTRVQVRRDGAGLRVTRSDT